MTELKLAAPVAPGGCSNRSGTPLWLASGNVWASCCLTSGGRLAQSSYCWPLAMMFMPSHSSPLRSAVQPVGEAADALGDLVPTPHGGQVRGSSASDPFGDLVVGLGLDEGAVHGVLLVLVVLVACWSDLAEDDVARDGLGAELDVVLTLFGLTGG